jgi:hypothetical protein
MAPLGASVAPSLPHPDSVTTAALRGAVGGPWAPVASVYVGLLERRPLLGGLPNGAEALLAHPGLRTTLLTALATLCEGAAEELGTQVIQLLIRVVEVVVVEVVVVGVGVVRG